MITEVTDAVHCLIQYIVLSQKQSPFPCFSLAPNKLDEHFPRARISAEQLDHFCMSLIHILMDHFQGHWHPRTPFRGQAYRCIRINASQTIFRDPRIVEAARSARILFQLADVFYRKDLTIWIDPGLVEVRFKEYGPGYVIDSSQKSRLMSIMLSQF